MEDIGFKEIKRYFKYPLSDYYIEFPGGPLLVGDEPLRIDGANHCILSSGTLIILTPTDCIKDRLASYDYFHDLQALNQAIMVAVTNKVNLTDIQRWSE